jgi:hypothetical protein
VTTAALVVSTAGTTQARLPLEQHMRLDWSLWGLLLPMRLLLLLLLL